MSDYKKDNIVIILALISLALFLYYIHYLIFGNLYGTVSSIFFGVAFTPIQVILNILVINKTMEKREKMQYNRKINIIIGTFFSEFGTELLAMLVSCDKEIEKVLPYDMVAKCLKEDCFDSLKGKVEEYNYKVKIEGINVLDIKEKLYENSNFLIELMTNSIIKEDESFTELLIALIHLKDEIILRYQNGKLEPYEMIHIANDMNIVYKKLAIEWVDYMRNLKDNYRQLFVRAMIDSPFDNRGKLEKDKEYLKL